MNRPPRDEFVHHCGEPGCEAAVGVVTFTRPALLPGSWSFAADLTPRCPEHTLEPTEREDDR